MIRFAIVGALNTLLTLAVIFGLKLCFDADDALANLLGYLLGLVNSYSLNRRWTFGHSGSIALSLPAFLLVQAVAYVVNLAVVLTVIAAGLNAYAAHVAGMPLYMSISYLGSRYFVFPSGRSSDRA